jgi:DNA-binding XRE family transcriptional regulator
MTPAEYKKMRRWAGTQKQVAEMLGVARETIARRETGKDKITKEAELAINCIYLREPNNRGPHDAEGS